MAAYYFLVVNATERYGRRGLLYVLAGMTALFVFLREFGPDICWQAEKAYTASGDDKATNEAKRDGAGVAA